MYRTPSSLTEMLPPPPRDELGVSAEPARQSDEVTRRPSVGGPAPAASTWRSRLDPRSRSGMEKRSAPIRRKTGMRARHRELRRPVGRRRRRSPAGRTRATPGGPPPRKVASQKASSDMSDSGSPPRASAPEGSCAWCCAPCRPSRRSRRRGESPRIDRRLAPVAPGDQLGAVDAATKQAPARASGGSSNGQIGDAPSASVG